MQMPLVTQDKKTNLTKAGFLFGLCFPFVGTLVEAVRLGLFSWGGLWQVQAQTPLLWIIDTAPFILALAGRLISPNHGFIPKVEKRIIPFLMGGLLLPLALLLFALFLEARATKNVSDTNQSGSLRYKSLYIFAATNADSAPRSWRSVLEEMKKTRADLGIRHPQDIAATEPAWQEFSRQLQATGQVSWASADRMRQAADVMAGSLEARQKRDQRAFLAVITFGLLSLLVGFAKSYELLQQIRAARVAMEESEYRFEKLTAAAFEGIALSQNGAVITANPQLCEMFGYSLNELTGMRAELFVAHEQREKVMHKIQQQDESPYETLALHKDGRPFPVEVEAKTVQYHGALARVTAIRDLSERIHIETELRDANEKLHRMATVDELTGLYNRRAFNQQLQTELDRAKRYDTPLSLLLLDVDKFKNINDTWGHDYGDEVLRGVSAILQKTVRPSDYVARYGGEEMVIILPNTNQEGAEQSAQRCRQAIEAATWTHRQVTASFGVSTMTENLSVLAEMVKAADSALYVSKESGRNRVTHFSSIEESEH
ncbi:sensor domain-containing diguanylate cyclase [bacterium]|nr:MAG: sensor domain-containing diguanylate cyclase [bacterium]